MSDTTMSSMFRTCAVTRLRIHRDAENLLKANAVAATVALVVGGIAALLILLTRWQVIHLLDPTWFYRMLTIHGVSMLIFFMIFFEMAVLYFAGPIVLNSRQPAPRVGWLAFALMVAGALLTEAMMWSGRADVMFTSYVPIQAHWLYYLGIILFAVGALVVVALFFATLVVAKREHTYEGSIPLVTFGGLAAACIAVVTLGHGAAIYVPTMLWALGVLDVDPAVYRLVFWGLGHPAQQINLAAMVSIWYLLGGLTVGAVVINEKISRSAFVLYILFINVASAHHLMVDPVAGSAWKVWNTSYVLYLAVLASMIHGFTIPAGIETSQRLRGFTQGVFGWLRRAPWGDPGFGALVWSIVIFGFVGGITGVTFGTEQINLIAHNTLRIPGHFHATVVGGTALAFMGATYYLIPLIFRRKVRLWPLAKIQPHLFAVGMLVFSTAMTFAGTFGVPRRHWDITFAGASFDLEYSPAVDLVIGIMAVGGILAALGGLIYVLVTVLSVFFGERYEPAPTGVRLAGVPQGITNPPAPLVGRHHSEASNKGTLVLVFVFLAAFALYYFVNWKLLSGLWHIG